MEKKAHGGRHSSKKRDAIANDDDSASEEPVKKSAKNEEKSTPNSSQSSSSSTSSEDVEFQQNLARSYERFRAAREATYRAWKRLDAQGDTVDGPGMADKSSELVRECDSLKLEVAELRNKEITANNEKSELARECDSLKLEAAELRNKEITANNLNCKLVQEHAVVKMELTLMKAKTEQDINELTVKCLGLGKDLDAVRQREKECIEREAILASENAALKQELEETKKKAEEDGIKDSARIEYPSHKLAQLDEQQNREQSPESMDEDQVAVEEPQSPAAQLQLQQSQSGPGDELDSALDSVDNKEIHSLWLINSAHMEELLEREQNMFNKLRDEAKSGHSYLEIAQLARLIVIFFNKKKKRREQKHEALEGHPGAYPRLIKQLPIAKQSLDEEFAHIRAAANKKDTKKRACKRR